MTRDKLGRRIVGIDDGYDTVEEAHEGKYNLDDDYRAVKDRAGGKWKKIISHMDALWHDKLGPDGCRKCTAYEDILYAAFEEIASMSFRDLDDLATKHRDDMKNELEIVSGAKDYHKENFLKRNRKVEVLEKENKHLNARLIAMAMRLGIERDKNKRESK